LITLNQTKTDMTNETKRLLNRLKIDLTYREDSAIEVLRHLKKLPLWKFSTGVYTLYVSAVRDLCGEDSLRHSQAKMICNERALTKIYEI